MAFQDLTLSTTLLKEFFMGVKLLKIFLFFGIIYGIILCNRKEPIIVE
jgi:hypothetical protein